MHPETAFVHHDHATCISAGIASAEAACAMRGAQFTPVRRRVLELLLEAHAALGAYDVLARLSEEGFGSKPPVAYRALAFLTGQGFAHRIERLNAFVACARPGAEHDPAFLICRGCGAVAEADLPGQGDLTRSAASNGFRIERTVVEAEGLCPDCQPLS